MKIVFYHLIYIYKTKNFQPVYLDEPNSDNNQKL